MFYTKITDLIQFILCKFILNFDKRWFWKNYQDRNADLLSPTLDCCLTSLAFLLTARWSIRSRREMSAWCSSSSCCVAGVERTSVRLSPCCWQRIKSTTIRFVLNKKNGENMYIHSAHMTSIKDHRNPKLAVL